MAPRIAGRDLILNIKPLSELGPRFSRIVSVPANYTLGQLYFIVLYCFTYDMKALATSGLKHDPYFYIHQGEIDDIHEIMHFGEPTQLVAYSPISFIFDDVSEGDTKLVPWTCMTVGLAFDVHGVLSDEDIYLFLQMWGLPGPHELIHVIERVGYSTETTAKAEFLGGHGQVSIVNNEFRYTSEAHSLFPAELQSIGQRLRSREVEEELVGEAWALPLDMNDPQ